MRALSGSASVFGVFGWPVGHSLSPAMHNAAIQALGLDGVYVPFAVPPEGLAAALSGVRALGIRGVNLTVPLKEAALKLVDEVSPYARRVGAVNTVENRAGELIGHNTDGEGFMAPLRASGFEVRGARAVVVGSGGAARAVVFALVDAGAEVSLINRTTGRAESLADAVRRETGHDVAVLGSAADTARAVAEAALVVNATSVGMTPHEHDLPPAPTEALRPGTVVYDLVYRPRRTRLLVEAAGAGAGTLDGTGMLVHQGAASFEIWTGVRPPTDVMAAALDAALTAE